MAGRKLRRKTHCRKSRGGHYKRFRCQTGGFLNRYDFAYAGKDTVDQAMKGLNSLEPRLIKQTSEEMGRLAQHRIKQIIDEDNQQVGRIAPKIICCGIKNVYKTLFRLLGSFGRNKLSQAKMKLSKAIKNFKK